VEIELQAFLTTERDIGQYLTSRYRCCSGTETANFTHYKSL